MIYPTARNDGTSETQHGVVVEVSLELPSHFLVSFNLLLTDLVSLPPSLRIPTGSQDSFERHVAVVY